MGTRVPVSAVHEGFDNGVPERLLDDLHQIPRTWKGKGSKGGLISERMDSLL